MKKYTFFLLIVVLFTYGCSAKFHLKQSKRHKLIAIQKGALIERDTVWIEKEVITKLIEKDTVFTSLQGDTVYIQKERLKIKYVKIPGDSVFIEGACIPDTLKILVPTTVTEIIHSPEPKFKWWHFILIGLAVGIIIALLLKK